MNVETLSRVPVHVHLETGSGSAPFVVVVLLLCLVSAQLMDPAEEFLPALISMSVSMTTWLGWWVLSVFCVFLCRNMFSGPGFLRVLQTGPQEDPVSQEVFRGVFD